MNPRGVQRDRWPVALACVALEACPGGGGDAPPASKNTPAVLSDTTGAMFEVVGGDLDRLRPLDGAELDDLTCLGESLAVGEAAFWLGETGLPMVCFRDPEGGGPLDFTCRPLACEAPAECPAGAACVTGICHYVHAPYVADPTRVDNLELVALCSAAMLRSTSCPFTDPAYAQVTVLIDAACGSGDDLCEVPAECEP